MLHNTLHILLAGKMRITAPFFISQENAPLVSVLQPFEHGR